MKSIYFLGECMVELTRTGESTMHQSFAGDVYNSAVYLKRCFSGIDTSLITVLGSDGLSQDMKAQFEQEQINTDCVFTSEDRVPGLYLVKTDDQGERSFTYWRNASAARTVMNYFDDQTTQNLLNGDMFFFSGISLAVIEPESREHFWQRLVQLRTAGVKVVFDPNYRARLWQSEDEAKQQFEKAFSMADILLPGIDDFSALYQLNNFDQVNTFLKLFNIAEIIVKNGPESVIAVVDNVTNEHRITPVSHVVDTTSAGDSFNGTYLGARLNGYAVKDAIELASRAAGYVIQHKGAIVDKDSFKQFMQPHLN